MTRVPFPTMKRPLVAILRGLKPTEAEAVVGTCGGDTKEIVYQRN